MSNLDILFLVLLVVFFINCAVNSLRKVSPLYFERQYLALIFIELGVVTYCVFGEDALSLAGAFIGGGFATIVEYRKPPAKPQETENEYDRYISDR